MSTLRAEGYDTDKGPAYLKYYERFFAPLQHAPINFLELGVFRGGSLLMWRDYFTHAQIVGLDLTPPPMPKLDRLHVFAGDASAPETFSMIERASGCGVFDIIIDDASHIGAPSQRTFEHLFRHRLRAGGLYVVEDWGTGYRADWPDGKVYAPPPPLRAGEARNRFPSHDYGMVGWVKQLVDLVGHSDIRIGGGRIDTPAVDDLLITPGLAFLRKSA